MRKLSILLVVLFTQFANASWLTSFDEAQKMALASNKFMIVDFWATWCGPCKKMDFDSWSNSEVNLVLDHYVQVKIDIDSNRELASKYGIESIPNMFIMDGNGKVVYSFMGYHDADQLKKELAKFAMSTEFLSNELSNFFKMNNYNTSIRVYQKYLDYSLLVDSNVKYSIIGISDNYWNEAKKGLSKTDENYLDKKQKLELLKLYELAYDMKFEKISKKLADWKESEITEGNKNQYYFLKYISAKALNSESLSTIESNAKQLDGFDSYIEKADFILSKRNS